MYLKYNIKRKGSFDGKIELRSRKENVYTFVGNDFKNVLEGKFYYYNSSRSKSIFLKTDCQRKLKKLIGEYNIEDFINNVEGEYCGVSIDYENRTLTIFSDKLKQVELYYFYNDDILIIAEDPKEIMKEIKELKYDQYGLLSAILLCVPKGHSLFKNIYRLKYNQLITVIRDKILIKSFDDKDIKIMNYSENDLLRYNRILYNAILSRASNNLNLVFSSGGWDSTLILSVLKEHFGTDKVRSVTMKIILSDGRCFNKFEVDKTKKIGRALGIKTDIIEIDYRNRELYQEFDDVKEKLFFKNLFFLPTNWSKAINYIGNKYGKDIVIFNGEGCDSLHNYGFSQYVSLSHDDENFQIYADKMKNYLFSPVFFKKAKDNVFLDDTVYKIFLFFNKDKDFTDVKNLDVKGRIYYYLLSFIFSDVRVPFRKVDYRNYVRPLAVKEFEKYLEEEYFEPVVKNINENNLYYYFSYLYLQFHLQSPQIRIFRNGLNNVRFPFIDLNLFKFLYKMPSNFGRGLEFNLPKFPLKRLAAKLFSEKVFKIIRSTPHSYLSEVEEIHIYDEYFLKGPVYRYMKDTINYEKVKNIFDPRIFFMSQIEKFIEKFQLGKLKSISSVEARFLIILTLLSVYSSKDALQNAGKN